MKLIAVIFDLDGTVVDSRKQWARAFLEVLRSLGKEVTNEDPVVHGFPIQDNWKTLLQKYNIKTDKTLEELESLTYKSYIKFLPEISLIEGAKDFLNDLKDSSVRIALATNSEWWVVEKIFENLGLEEIFDATVTGEETPNKKPFPDAFLLAADKLSLPSEGCLVIGDTEPDVEAAHAAGMKAIIIGDAKNADLNVEGFSEITPKAIDQL